MGTSPARVRALPLARPATGVRALEPDDLPAVASLFQRVMAPASTVAGVERLFHRVLLEDPWADPELPSLVAIGDDGELTGFFLGGARRFRHEGRPLRGLCGMYVLVDPQARNSGAGFELLTRMLRGAQDFSYTGGAPDAIRPLLARLACRPLQLESLEWTSILRPAGYWRGRLRSLARGRSGGIAARWPVGPLDQLLASTPLTPPVTAEGLADEPLTPELMMVHFDELTGWAALRPDYDLPFLRWLFAQLADDHPQGELAARLVRRDGRAIGWHVSLVERDGLAEVMQVVARPADTPAVLAALHAHAHAHGATAVRGRLEAALLDAITTRRTLLRRASFVMMRAPQAGVLGPINAGDALFSRLDADWWIDPRGR